MRFFALTTATADLPEVPDIQESLTAIQKFSKTASPVVLLGILGTTLVIGISGKAAQAVGRQEAKRREGKKHE